jgi:deoxyribodipyrimidine photo-lyase
MTRSDDLFPPTRRDALDRLSAFLPRAGAAYASRRNHDLGPGRQEHVSMLSPYIRHRTLTEAEVLEAVLARHSRSTAEKFIQEVFWRTYWKGWLEMRPAVWTSYRAELRRDLDAVATQGGLRRSWEAACSGETRIACFDAWARELVETGYLHNHARMWFASIWIFTLELPWTLGADFFLRHLLDGDPASNTLGWRWVAGLQTRGKTYLARPDNIAKYTDGRFRPGLSELAAHAPPLDGPENPPRSAPPEDARFDPAKPTAFILHEDDLSPAWLVERGLRPVATATLNASSALSPLDVSPEVLDFRAALTREAADRWSERLGPLSAVAPDAGAIAAWARDQGAEQIVAAYAPVGPVKDVLDGITELPVIRPVRAYDLAAWPHAKAGFFKFREQIPRLIGALKGLHAA